MNATRAAARFAGVATAVLTACSAFAAEPGFTPVDVHSAPITEFRAGETDDRFGDLEFRGGLTLFSGDPMFGSWSGLDFSADGTLHAVADEGVWFTAKLVEDGDRLIGIDDPMVAPMLDEDGKPFVNKRRADAEGLRIVTRDGRETALVSFEHETRVEAYALTPDLSLARPQYIPLPVFVYGIPGNTGLEAIAVAPPAGPIAGATVVIAEHALNKNHDHRGFILDGPNNGPFAIRRLGDFDITDATFLPSGDLLILERKLNLSEGLFMRIRRIAAATLRQGATVDGPILIVADISHQIDNMEGLAVRTSADGETLINLISDDNHSLLQRTVLLQFALKPAPPPLPRPRPPAATVR
jgi:hypothetical protein